MNLQVMVAEITVRTGSWPVRFALRETGADHTGVDVRIAPGTRQAHLECAECGQSVLCLSTRLDDPGAGYDMTSGGISASVGAHIRQCHTPDGS